MGGSNVFQYAPNPTGWIDPFGLAKNPGDCHDPNAKLSDNNNFPGHFAEQYDEINLGNGTPRRERDGSIKIYEGREHPAWKGAVEYEVPNSQGVQNNNDRILRMPDGRMGYIRRHYKTIYPFPYLCYPEGGSNARNNWKKEPC